MPEIQLLGFAAGTWHGDVVLQTWQHQNSGRKVQMLHIRNPQEIGQNMAEYNYTNYIYPPGN